MQGVALVFVVPQWYRDGQPKPSGLISGLIRLQAAAGDDDVATGGELDVGPAQNRHLAAA